MPHISILKELLKKDVVVPLEDHPYGKTKKQVTLREEGQYSVAIRGLPEEGQVIVVKTDSFPAPSNIFKNSKGECKRADFVIISDTGNKKIILYIEMKAKSDTTTAKHIINQLKGSQCVIKYTQEIGKQFWDTCFLDNFEARFVCLRNISISKKQTRLRTQKSIHNNPENMLKINSPHYLQFNQLIGK